MTYYIALTVLVAITIVAEFAIYRQAGSVKNIISSSLLGGVGTAIFMLLVDSTIHPLVLMAHTFGVVSILLKQIESSVLYSWTIDDKLTFQFFSNISSSICGVLFILPVMLFNLGFWESVLLCIVGFFTFLHTVLYIWLCSNDINFSTGIYDAVMVKEGYGYDGARDQI